MRFEDTFYGTDIIQGEKKRQRVLSSRFKNEYVDDPVYRTFLKSPEEVSEEAVVYLHCSAGHRMTWAEGSRKDSLGCAVCFTG